MMWIPETMKPTRTTTRIYDILKEWQARASEQTVEVMLSVINSDGVTIVSTGAIFPLWLKYGDFLYSQSNLVVGMIDSDIIDGAYIFDEWYNYNRRNADNLTRMLDALFAEYNPIENYSMIESGADGEKEDKTTTTPHGTITNTQYTAGVNSTGNGAVSGENVTSYQNADSETQPSNTQTMNFNGDTFSGFYKAKEHYFKRAGNIGVTTSAQMITQEIELRKYQDLISQYVHTFIMQYCYFVG